MYESKFEKHGAGGRDPRGSAKKEDDFKWNERRWTGEEDRVEEWRTKLQEETKRLEKQNTVASENPSLESRKSEVTSIRTGSLDSYEDSKLRLTPNKGRESLYENNILEYIAAELEEVATDQAAYKSMNGTLAQSKLVRESLVATSQGSLKVVISVYPYLQKTPNFSRFYKKLGPFYKKLRCDKLGN